MCPNRPSRADPGRPPLADPSGAEIGEDGEDAPVVVRAARDAQLSEDALDVLLDGAFGESRSAIARFERPSAMSASTWRLRSVRSSIGSCPCRRRPTSCDTTDGSRTTRRRRPAARRPRARGHPRRGSSAGKPTSRASSARARKRSSAGRAGRGRARRGRGGSELEVRLFRLRCGATSASAGAVLGDGLGDRCGEILRAIQGPGEPVGLSTRSIED